MTQESSQFTQTQTQNSQIQWSQRNPLIPNIWGRLYSCVQSTLYNEEYFDLVKSEFSLGRSLTCTFVIKRDMFVQSTSKTDSNQQTDIIKNVSKQHFVLRRDMTESLSPAMITDYSYNGTFVNGVKIGKGKSRVLDDNDEIAVTHADVKIFVFKDLLKNEQEEVPEEISTKYYISRTLGQGACGIVKLVYNKNACTKHAMKVVKKSRLSNGQESNINDPAKIMNEVNIMKALSHPCIVSIEELYDSAEAVYIVLELMQGGELFDRISKQGRLPERLAKFLFRQMVLAVKYLHSQGITHRDLKPENVLLESQEDETLVKITDFGLSKFVGEDSFMKTMCGTPLYVAPEVLRANGMRNYGPEVDVWSLGVILFTCLAGYLPFSAEYTEATLPNQILKGRYRYAASHWRGVSGPALHLVRRMLTVPVSRRITFEGILQHPWMQDPDVTLRVDRLLNQAKTTRSLSKLTTSSGSDEENAMNGVTANLKRTLSVSSDTCEPQPKKLRLTLCLDKGMHTDSSTVEEDSS